MLKTLRLDNFKGFRRCTVGLRKDNVLVGANNAGKSTVVSALRLVASVIPTARRFEPSVTGVAAGATVRGWPLTQASLDNAAFADDNVRHDFRSAETRITAEFDNGSRLVIVWPAFADDDPEPSPFFYLTPPPKLTSGMKARKIARDLCPDIGIVPTLSPVDDRENYVQDQTLHRNLTGRRTSRYFRNALFRLQNRPDDWTSFCKYLEENTPEVHDLSIERRIAYKEDELDAFLSEQGQTRRRELTWAGDGIQIWIQALYHLWRQSSCGIIVLDEPDVYLHPDLQRRLARIVFSSAAQVIIATHSVEILAEAQVGAAVWIDRDRASAKRITSEQGISDMGRRLGSAIELSLARALRGRAALFVEGEDLKILSILAKTVGAERLATRSVYATVPLGGFTRHWLATGFAEVMNMLGSEVSSIVLLDGDLRGDASREYVANQFTAANVDLHIWQRRELENYILSPVAVSNAAGVSLNVATALLDESIEDLKSDALIALQNQRLLERSAPGSTTGALAPQTILENSQAELETLWQSFEGRCSTVDAKRVISAVNTRLQARKMRTVNASRLAEHLSLIEIPDEVATYLNHVEQLLHDAVSRP